MNTVEIINLVKYPSSNQTEKQTIVFQRKHNMDKVQYNRHKAYIDDMIPCINTRTYLEL